MGKNGARSFNVSEVEYETRDRRYGAIDLLRLLDSQMNLPILHVTNHIWKDNLMSLLLIVINSSEHQFKWTIIELFYVLLNLIIVRII